MKRLLLLMLLSLCMVCNAQTNHMKFNGITIEGTVNSFVEKLKQQGYTYQGQEKGITLLKGEFATFKECVIVVMRFSDRDQIAMVGVIFPEDKTWEEITSRYLFLKEKLTEKYGKPECVEKFSDREPSTDDLRVHAILDGKCKLRYIREFRF